MLDLSVIVMFGVAFPDFVDSVECMVIHLFWPHECQHVQAWHQYTEYVRNSPNRPLNEIVIDNEIEYHEIRIERTAGYGVCPSE